MQAVRRRLLEGGYTEGIKAADHPGRKRVYFLDPCGNEYEFIEYTSADLAQRNQYDTPSPG